MRKVIVNIFQGTACNKNNTLITNKKEYVFNCPFKINVGDYVLVESYITYGSHRKPYSVLNAAQVIKVEDDPNDEILATSWVISILGDYQKRISKINVLKDKKKKKEMNKKS